MRTVRPLVASILLLAPAAAAAGTVVLTPPILGKGATAKQVEDVYTLISAELEFMDGVDEVVELAPAPPSLTSSCLDSARCLASIVKTSGGTHLVAGDLERVGTDIVLDMVYFDAATGSTLRRATWTVAPEPAAMVERIPALLRELVTGRTVQQKVAEERMTDVDFSGGPQEEEFAFEEAKPVAPPPPPPPPKTTTSSRAPGSTSTRVTNATIVAPPPPPPPPAEADFDPSAFSFSGDADDIEFGTTAADVGTAPAPRPAPPPAPRPTYDELDEEPAPVRRAPPVYEEEEPAPIRRAPPVYEEEPPPPRRPTYVEDEEPAYVERPVREPSRSSSSSASRSPSKPDPIGEKRFYVPVRGGYASYGDYGATDLSQDILFHFGTVGVELQVRAAAGFTIVLGGTGWIVTRQTPPDLVAEGAPAVSTSLLPLVNGGFIYRFRAKRAQPYLGIDGVLLPLAIAPTRAGEVGRTALAGGGRARLGLDVFVAKNLALNGDIALGYLAGADWPVVDPRLPGSAFMPQISGGIVLAF